MSPLHNITKEMQARNISCKSVDLLGTYDHGSWELRGWIAFRNLDRDFTIIYFCLSALVQKIAPNPISRRKASKIKKSKKGHVTLHNDQRVESGRTKDTCLAHSRLLEIISTGYRNGKNLTECSHLNLQWMTQHRTGDLLSARLLQHADSTESAGGTHRRMGKTNLKWNISTGSA